MENPVTQQIDPVARQRDTFIEGFLQSVAGVFNTFGIYLGDRLGLYQALVDDGPATSADLAARTGTHERYIREWLEQQTVAGVLMVEDETRPAAERRYFLPPGHVEPLTDCDSLNFMAPLAQLVAGAVHPLADILRAYHTGEGVPFSAYGDDLREGQAAMNCPAFTNQLPGEWLPAIPDVHARLLAAPPARVADVGCGFGWSSIGMAKGYPDIQVDGFDLDEPSIHRAVENARDSGVSGRVTFHARNAGDPALGLAGRYDLVTAFECIHDMADPVGVLRTMRTLAGPHGTVLVVDERVSNQFTASGNDVEWMMYGFSILHCLPAGMDHPASTGTGTVMRPDTLRHYADQAGFRAVEVLPIDNFFFRFYRLVL